MTKWSSFIRNLGTAGPSTVQGIYDLGFALRSEVVTLLGKFVRVDAPQVFSNPEKQQGRDNLGLGSMATQNSSSVAISGGSIAGITDLAVSDGGTGASDPTNARANLGLGNVDNTSDLNKPVSNPQQTALNLKADLASPAFTGNPTVPTQAVGNNSTRAASTAFVRAEFPNLLNAVGAAPVYACRAWVTFNGTGSVAILASGNVSSITDNGVGDYDINFTIPMPDANYAVVASGRRSTGPIPNSGSGSSVSIAPTVNPTVSVVRVFVCDLVSTSSASSIVLAADQNRISIGIFR